MNVHRDDSPRPDDDDDLLSPGVMIETGDEDALDDGFILCDLTVIERKLSAWRELFPRIKPFYAVKCNPNPMVAAGR